MKLQRTPLLLLLVAGLLAGGVFLYEFQIAPQRAQEETQRNRLFSFQEADIRELRIQTPANRLVFVKRPAQPASPASSGNQTAPSPAASPERLVWWMTEPKDGLANDATVAFLLNLMVNASSANTLTVPAARLAEFGLEPSRTTIEVKLANQQTHRLRLGQPDFSSSNLYALVDPSSAPGDRTIKLVSLDFESALNRPLAEWEQPVEAENKPKDGSKRQVPQ
jgi:hypothetical protein